MSLLILAAGCRSGTSSDPSTSTSAKTLDAPASALSQILPLTSAEDLTTPNWPVSASIELERCEYEGRGRWWPYGSINGVEPGATVALDLELSSGDVGSGYRTAATVAHQGSFKLLYDASEDSRLTAEQLESGFKNFDSCQIVVRGTEGHIGQSNVATTLAGPLTVLTTMPARFGTATITPATVHPGTTITIKPAVPVALLCDRTAELIATTNGYLWTIYLLGYPNVAASPGATVPQRRDCEPETSHEPLSFTLPTDLTAADYLICFGNQRNEDTCIKLTIAT